MTKQVKIGNKIILAKDALSALKIAQKVNDMFGTNISVTFDSAWTDTEEKAGDKEA